jgi:excisionase family DNA binding protein
MPRKSAPARSKRTLESAAHYDPVLSIDEAAEYTGYSYWTIRREIVARNMAASRRPGTRSSWRIRLSELNRWLDRNSTKRSRVQM